MMPMVIVAVRLATDADKSICTSQLYALKYMNFKDDDLKTGRDIKDWMALYGEVK